MQRTLKQQFQSLEQQFPNDYALITSLPLIETVDQFEESLQKVNQLDAANDYYKLILQKLTQEKKLWTKCYQMKYFTGGISVCQRNEAIK